MYGLKLDFLLFLLNLRLFIHFPQCTVSIDKSRADRRLHHIFKKLDTAILRLFRITQGPIECVIFKVYSEQETCIQTET